MMIKNALTKYVANADDVTACETRLEDVTGQITALTAKIANNEAEQLAFVEAAEDGQKQAVAKLKRLRFQHSELSEKLETTKQLQTARTRSLETARDKEAAKKQDELRQRLTEILDRRIELAVQVDDLFQQLVPLLQQMDSDASTAEQLHRELRKKSTSRNARNSIYDQLTHEAFAHRFNAYLIDVGFLQFTDTMLSATHPDNTILAWRERGRDLQTIERAEVEQLRFHDLENA